MRTNLLGGSLVLLAGTLIAGCSIHPSPVDFPRTSTYDIAKKIRCEAKHALIALKDRPQFDKYYDDNFLQCSSVAYRFQLTATEKNNAEAGAAFTMPISSGLFTFGVSAGEGRERVGDKEFTVTDTFEELLRTNCADADLAPRENWRYPITGKVGLEKTFDTFLMLATNGLLDQREKAQGEEGAPTGGEDYAARGGGGRGARPGGRGGREGRGDEQGGGRGRGGDSPGGRGGRGGDKSNTWEYTDSLTFTTTLKAGVNPKIELNPTATRLKLAEADGNLSAERTDKHQLVVTLVLPDKATARKLRELSARRTRNSRAVLEDAVAQTCEVTQEEARTNIQSQKSLFYQQRLYDLMLQR